MKTKKSLLKSVLCVLILVFSVFAFAACGECEHVWGEWSISAHSTCSTQGTKQRKCSKCEEIQFENIDIADHQYDVENIAWNWNGYESATATLSCVTDSTHTRQINANITDEITTAPTCTLVGTKTYTATIKIDGVTYTATKNETLSALGHTEVIDPAVTASCLVEGLTEGSHCSVCKKVFIAQESLGKLSHKETVLNAVAPSCSEEGLTEGKKCSVCGTVTVEQESIDKLPHTEETVVGKAATCSATGLSDGIKCSVCKETLVAQTILPKTACDYVSVETAPTCEEQGYTTHTCSMCKDSFVDTYVEKLGHKWGAWEVSGSYTLRNCINECNCGKYQRITSINATYNGIRLLTGESVWRNDVTVTATLSDNTTIDISDFALENDVMTVDGANYVTVNFKTLSTTVSVPAIYDNLPRTTSVSEFTYDKNGDAITITGFIGSATEIIIPAHIERVPVRYIGESAFNGQENIKSVVIPNSIYTIAEEAFYNCKRLISATLGNNLTTIGAKAFNSCISLEEITIPANIITIDGHWNGGGAFENCTGLKKVIIGDEISNVATTSIGERTFYNCTALKEVYIGNQVKSIGTEAFYGCSAMTTATIGSAVKTIGSNAFANCEALLAVNIPDSVTVIESEAFFNCKRLKTVNFGSGLTTIGAKAFNSCISLEEINIPANVITIDGHWNGGGAFENCTALKKVIIGDDTIDIATTTIGERAFYNCTALKEAYIGNQVKSIGTEAFYGCLSMTSVAIGVAVETIGSASFANCEALLAIVVPDSVTLIDSESFYNCKRIETVTLGKGLTTIGAKAFNSCISLKEINIPTNVITIDGHWNNGGAFENCTALKKVTIGDDNADIATTTIGERTFANCTALTEVFIGSNVKTIAENAFEGCTSLVNFNIGTGVQRIGAYALQNCSSLKSVAIPANVQVIGAGLFNNCSSLEEVIIEKGVLREVGNDVFNGCSSFDRIYYTGTASDWVLVAVSEDNSYPLNVSPYYYSSSSPSGKGNYWYYNSNGEIRVWNVSETSFKAEEYSEKLANSTFGSSNTSYSSQFLSQLEGDSLFQARILIWEALHIATDWESKAISKKDVYKMVIYDLLVGEADAQVNPLAGMDAACNSYVYDFAKFLLGKDSLTKAELDQLKNLSPLDYDYVEMVDKYFKGIDVLKEVFEMSTNLYDALYVAAQYKALSDMDTNFYLVLTEISNDGSLPWDLRNAASECADCYRTATDALLKKIVVQEFASSTMEVLWKDFQDEAWKAVLGSVFPQVKFADLTIKGAMFLANMGFNLDACNEAYYQLEAAVGLENALRNVIKNTLPDYLRYNYKDKSEYYMYAIDMYQTSVLLGFDYSNNLLREHSKSADVNAEEKQAYENMMVQISGMKQEKETMYNNFESVIEQLYVAYYV